MENVNVGTFIFEIAKGLMNFTKTLYDVFTTKVNISWLNGLLDFFHVDITFPESISLLWILSGASGVVILGILIYNIFKL